MSQQEERGIRNERDRRSHALCGPRVDISGFTTQTAVGEHLLPLHSSLVGGVVRRQVLWSSPPPLPQGRAETQPGQAAHSIHLLQQVSRQMRLRPGTFGGSFGESKARIQWGTLALWITSEWRVRKPTRGQACQGGSRLRGGEKERLSPDEVLWVPAWIFWLLKPTNCFFKLLYVSTLKWTNRWCWGCSQCVRPPPLSSFTSNTPK